MSYKLFLDDIRTPDQVKWVKLPNGPYVVARSHAEFVAIITSRGIPEFVAFDHDLADEHYAMGELHNNSNNKDIFNHNYGNEKTGFDCAKWLVDYCISNELEFPQYAVHSMNPVGAERIHAYISQAKKIISYL